MAVGMIWRAGVFSYTGVVVIGTVGVTMLHPRGPGDPELPPTPEVAPPPSEEYLRAVCKDGDQLCTIYTKMVPESPSSGERLKRPRRSTVNSKLSKQMVSPRARPTPVGLLPLATNESFSEVTIRTSKGKACCKSPFLVRQLSIFFSLTRYRWSRSHIPVLRWSYEQLGTQ
jgi:hypothetical protein